MKSKLTFIFITLQLSVLSQDKVSFEGYVYDDQKAPIPFANVFIQSKETMQIIAFAQTDELGFFKLSVPVAELVYVLKVSMLGYKSQEQIINNSSLGVTSFTFELIPDIIALKDIVVKAKKDVIQQKDTVTFLADAYRDSTENTLEDLLQKIPGIDVEKSTGKITVQGKPIKKILIDGDDLTGKNYQLSSQNLPADIVSQIEIISRFTDNSLLQGIEYSQDIVLNINLKDTYKSKWVGNLDANIGNNEHYKMYANLMRFSKKIKTLSFIGANNIGQNSIAEQLNNEQFQSIKDNDGSTYSIINYQTPWIKNNDISSISRNQNVLFNQSIAGSTSLIAHINKNVQAKFTVLVTQDNNQLFLNNDIRYIFQDSLFILTENIIKEVAPVTLLGKFELNWKINLKSSLKYEKYIRKHQLFNKQQTVANQNTINEDDNNNTLDWGHRLEYTYKFNNKLVLMLESAWQKYDYSQTYQTTQTNFRTLPATLGMFQASSLFQNNNGNTDIKNFKSTLYYRTKNFQITNGIYFSRMNDTFNSQLSAYNQDDQLSLGDNAKNNQLFIQKDYTSFLNIRYNYKSLSIFSNFLLGYYQAQYAQSKNYNKFYILPSIGARIDKNNHTISTTYMFTTKMPQVLDISTGERLVGYRSFESGSTLLVPQFNHTGLLNYIYGNFEGDFLFYINGIFTYQPRGYRSNWLISSDFNSTEKVENFFANQTSNIMLGIEQYFPKYSFTIKIRPSVSQGIYQNNLNDSDLNRTNTVWEYKLNTSIKSGFLKVFNYNLGINLVWQNIYSQKNIFTQYNTNTYLDLNFKFSKKIKLNVSQELITVKSDGISRQNYYFMNASFLYEVIKSKFSINIDARNLTNTKEFISNAISDFININRSIKLLNRFILLGASYKF